MTRFIFDTATSLNGWIADEDNSLAWLFAVDGGSEPDAAMLPANATVLVEGSTTYEWIPAEEDILDHPEKWRGFHGDRPTFVFTTRSLPTPEGADVRFVSGPVADALPAIRAAAGDGDVWVVGVGDLAGQFLDATAVSPLNRGGRGAVRCRRHGRGSRGTPRAGPSSLRHRAGASGSGLRWRG